MVEMLKKINRTLLEMHIGILVWGIACCGVGLFFAGDRIQYCLGIGFGVLLAMLSIFHMYRTLDRALDYDGKTATNVIFRGYLTRYVLFAVILFILMVTNVLNPLVVFLAYMGIKVTALIQPITHKLCTKMFHEK
jgi:uncharacterized Tic20 family protein